MTRYKAPQCNTMYDSKEVTTYIGHKWNKRARTQHREQRRCHLRLKNIPLKRAKVSQNILPGFYFSKSLNRYICVYARTCVMCYMIKHEHEINNNKNLQSFLRDFWNYAGIPCPNLTQSDLCRSLINYGSFYS